MSATGREQDTTPPSASASSCATGILSASLIPLPTETSTSACVISTSPTAASIYERNFLTAKSPSTDHAISRTSPETSGISSAGKAPALTVSSRFGASFRETAALTLPLYICRVAFTPPFKISISTTSLVKGIDIFAATAGARSMPKAVWPISRRPQSVLDSTASSALPYLRGSKSLSAAS